jgi:hypothetical protein
LATGLTSPEYLAVDLTFGTTYEFKVESRNSYSYSPYSETLTLLCAFKPDPPLVVTTTNTNDLVTVQWDDPIANGFVIHAYRFFVLQSDGTTYTEESVECDGTNTDIVNNRVCTISLLTLRSAPYNLILGDSVWVKVISVNTYGESELSQPGNGAVIQLVPDAPINLTNDLQVTNANAIKLSWEEGASNGGIAVIDYAVFYYPSGVNIITAPNVLLKEYTTTTVLEPGVYYNFKVSARNPVGTSALSETVQIIAATYADSPVLVQNVPGITTQAQIGLAWSEGPYNGGTPVLDYQVSYKEATSADYTVYSTLVAERSDIIISLTAGKSYDFVV